MRLIRKKEKRQVTNTKNKKNDIATDSINIKKIRECYEQPYASKFNHKDEMDNPLRHKLPEHIQEEIT